MPIETLAEHNARRQDYWAKVHAPLTQADALCDQCGERLHFADKTLTLATLPPISMGPLPVECQHCGFQGEMLR